MGTAGRTIGLSLLNAFVCASSVNALKEFSSLSDKVFLLRKGMYWWSIEVRNAAISIVGGELRANDRRLNEGRMRGSAFARNGEGEGQPIKGDQGVWRRAVRD